MLVTDHLAVAGPAELLGCSSAAVGTTAAAGPAKGGEGYRGSKLFGVMGVVR